MDRTQRTLRRTVFTAGVGLHTGVPVRLWIRPAPAGHGIRFRRRGTDETVPARVEAARDLAYATRIGHGDAAVSTVEHLLAALAALGVDNALVELDGPEVPILDGSAWPFVRLIRRAGLEAQEEPVAALRILEPIEVRDDGRWIRVEPSDRFEVDYRIAFDNPLVGFQRWSGAVDDHRFAEEIAPARTFGFLKDVTYLKSRGLIRGGSLANCVVVDGTRVLSGELRFTDEFVRHKVLDLIGDLALLDYRLQGRVVAHRAGHALHAALVRAILAAPQRWQIRRLGPAAPAPVSPFALELEPAAAYA